MDDRRFETRLRRCDPVDLVWNDQTGKKHSRGSELTDISSSGAAVRADSPLRVGTKVSFGYRSQTLVGKVKHCIKRGGGFLIGIEFDSDRGWSFRTP